MHIMLLQYTLHNIESVTNIKDILLYRHRRGSGSFSECEEHWGAVQHHQDQPGEEIQQDLSAAGGVEHDHQEDKFIQETIPHP